MSRGQMQCVKEIDDSDGSGMTPHITVPHLCVHTIPKTLRDRFGLHKDVEVELIPANEGVLIQKRSRSKHPVDRVYGILNRPSDTDSYIEEIRGR